MLIPSIMSLASTPYLKSAKVPGSILDRRIKQTKQKRKLQRRNSRKFCKIKKSTSYSRRNRNKKQSRDTKQKQSVQRKRLIRNFRNKKNREKNGVVRS